MFKLDSFLKVLVLGLVVRLIASLFTHPWDIQTFYNFFVDLARNHSPYETMAYLSHLARAHSEVGWDYNFEYYAYPPLPILIYYLPAKLFSLIHLNLDYNFVISHAAPVVKIPWDFNLLFKLPLYLSDLGVAYLLFKKLDMKSAKWFFLNPYVILISSSWMFDSLMTFFLLLSIVLLREGRLNLSALFLAFSAVTKFVPFFVFPALIIYFIKQEYSFKKILSFIGIFVLTNLAIILPFWEGFKFVLDFHSSRVGGGLTPHLLLQQLPYYLSNNFITYKELLPIYHFVLPNIGLLFMGVGILFVYYLIIKNNLSLNQVILISLLGYLIFNKIINEQYLFIAMPFLIWDLKESPSQIKFMLYQLLWALPLAFAIINVPILGFSLPILNILDIDIRRLQLYIDWVTGSSPRLWFLRISALTFTATVVVYTWYTIKNSKFKDQMPNQVQNPNFKI